MRPERKRDDFTWILLFLESLRNHKSIPLKRTQSNYYNHSNTFSQGFRFSDEKQAEEEQKRRIRRAQQLRLAYTILAIVITFLLAIFLS
ncbi:MAG: hypothetical protein ACYCPW_11265 [Nitrososphaerales archaeon]